MAKLTSIKSTQDDCSSDSLRIDRCCDLARLGGSAVQTNPQVGAVLVEPKDNNIISENYHHLFGGPHAEINAMQSSDRQHFRSHSIYVSLEPCSHSGKTPPCADSIVKHGFNRCVIAHRDPNPQVDGQGIKLLRQSGVEVDEVHSKKADRILRRFIVNQKLGRPYIILKWAQSADGFIGRDGESIQISNQYTRRLVHKWRSEIQAIFVGTDTALSDNPQLDNRFYYGPSPIRVTIDRNGRLPSHLHLMDSKIPTLIFAYEAHESSDHVQYALLNKGNEELDQVFRTLYSKNIGSVMIEGGAKLLGSCIGAGFWDECRVITSSTKLDHGIPAPTLPTVPFDQVYSVAGDTVRTLLRPL